MRATGAKRGRRAPTLRPGPPFGPKKSRIMSAVFGTPPVDNSAPPNVTIEFIRFMADEAHRLGAKFSLVILPGARLHNHVDVDSLKRGLDGVNLLDLGAKAEALGLYGTHPSQILPDQILPDQMLPDGHYNAKLAAVLGAEIGSEICRTGSGGHGDEMIARYVCHTPNNGPGAPGSIAGRFLPACRCALARRHNAVHSQALSWNAISRFPQGLAVYPPRLRRGLEQRLDSTRRYRQMWGYPAF
jgi:hypothetical protein